MEGDYERPAALITFDDGMLGYFSNAVPIMTDRQIPSINFLNIDTIEGNPSWAGLVTYLADVDVDFQRKIGHDEDGPPVEITLVSPGIVREYLSSVGDESLVGRVREFTGAIATRRDLETVQDSSLVFLGNHLANHYSTLTLGKEELSEQYSKKSEPAQSLRQRSTHVCISSRSLQTYPERSSRIPRCRSNLLFQ
jgi:hypothetical protein